MIYIKCSEQECQTVNRIDKTALQKHVKKGGKPVFACKGCKTKLEIVPLKARCNNPNCGLVFSYFEFLVNEQNALVLCPHCKAKNRVKVMATT